MELLLVSIKLLVHSQNKARKNRTSSAGMKTTASPLPAQERRNPKDLMRLGQKQSRQSLAPPLRGVKSGEWLVLAALP